MAVLPPIARILATNVGYPFIMPAKVRLCMYSSPLKELHNNICNNRSYEVIKGKDFFNAHIR